MVLVLALDLIFTWLVNPWTCFLLGYGHALV